MVSIVSTLAICALAGQRALISMLNLNPQTPIPGENQTLEVEFSFQGLPITGGQALYTASANQVPLPTQTFDLCTQTDCPIEAGTHIETSTWTVPTNFLGHLNSKITWIDQNNEPVWCVQITLDIDDTETTSSGSSGSSGSSSSSSGSSGSSSSSSGSSGSSSSSSGSSGSSSSSSGSSGSSGSSSNSSVASTKLRGTKLLTQI